MRRLLCTQGGGINYTISMYMGATHEYPALIQICDKYLFGGITYDMTHGFYLGSSG